MIKLVYALSCSLLVFSTWGQSSLGSGNNNDTPSIGTPISPAGTAGTGAAPTGPGGGTPDSLFPSLDTSTIDSRTNDIPTPQAQESLLNREVPVNGTGVGTGIGSGTGPDTGTEYEVPDTTP